MKKFLFIGLCLFMAFGLKAQVTEADLLGRWEVKKMVTNGAVSDTETGEFISADGTRTPLTGEQIQNIKKMYMAFSTGFMVEVGERSKKTPGTYTLSEKEGVQYLTLNSIEPKRPIELQVSIENKVLKLTLQGKRGETGMYLQKSE